MFARAELPARTSPVTLIDLTGFSLLIFTKVQSMKPPLSVSLQGFVEEGERSAVKMRVNRRTLSRA